MKKCLCLGTLLSSILFCAAPVQAQEISPYVGFDYQRTQVNYNGSDSNNIPGFVVDDSKLLNSGLNGGDVHVGAKVGKFFGLELGYFDNLKSSKDVAAGTYVGHGNVIAVPLHDTVSLQGITLDALGYVPLSDKFDLIGTAGILYNKASLGGDASGHSYEWDFRGGGGAQFNITNELNLRGLIRYQTADFASAAKNAWIYSLGLNYSLQ